MSYVATLHCNGLRCTESISAESNSHEAASTLVQARASANRWRVAADRLVANVDFCPRCCTRPSERG